MWFFACLSVYLIQTSLVAGAEAEFSVAERGPHHRVVERVTWERNAFDQPTASTNRYTELETGMHFQRGGQWLESRAEIKLTTEGAAATNCASPVAFAPDLNRVGAVELTLPDGRHMRSRVLGLAYYDTSSGESVLIAQTRNSTGLLFEPNQVIYTNAFAGSGVEADVQYIVAKAGLQQNILLRALPLPEAISLNPQTTRLQCLTEFFDAPVPELRAGVETPDGLSDDTVDFSLMVMPPGKAFAIGAAEADAKPVPVFKRWVVLGNGRTFLVEQIPVVVVRTQLERLPASGGGAGLNPRRSGAGKSMLAALEAIVPESPGTAEPSSVQMARLDSWVPRGFLLDYSLVSSASNFTFKGDTTYYVTNTVNLSGMTVIEGGTVIKFSTNHFAQINVTGGLDCQTGPFRPAVFSVRDDNTVGETIAGSTGTPTNAYGNGLVISSGGNTLKYARFSYLERALNFDISFGPAELSLAQIQFTRCRYPLRADQWSCFASCGATINLDNALAYGCDIFFQGEYGILRARHLTVNQCNTLGNLFFGGTLYFRALGDDPLLLAYDNLFDRTTLTKGISSANFTHNYNGYVTNQNRLTPNGANDVVLTNTPLYHAGPLGRFYYPTNYGNLSRLIDAGSSPADDVGLYHFTTVTNQVKETNSFVDIGYHYVALNTNAVPFDTDGDGTSDYLDPDSTPRTDIVWSNSVWHWKANSLAWNCVTNARACTNGLQGAFSNMFTTYAHGMPIDERNTNFWFRRFKGWPAYSVWNNGNTNLWPTNGTRTGGSGVTYQHHGVMVTPEHFLTAGHVSMDTNHWLAFMDISNNVVFRQIKDFFFNKAGGVGPNYQNNLTTNMPSIPFGDYYIGLLDQPVPDSIGFARIIPTNWVAWFDAPFLSSGPANPEYPVPLYVWNCQHRTPVMLDLTALQCFFTNRELYFNEITLTNWKDHNVEDGGDSGSPWFFVLEGELCLAKINRGAFSFMGGSHPLTYPAYQHAYVNAAMAELSLRNGRTNIYSLTVKDLSNYPTYGRSYNCPP